MRKFLINWALLTSISMFYGCNVMDWHYWALMGMIGLIVVNCSID